MKNLFPLAVLPAHRMVGSKALNQADTPNPLTLHSRSPRARGIAYFIHITRSFLTL